MIAAHADWSIGPGKRWITVARRGARGWAARGAAAGRRSRGAAWTAAAPGVPVALGLDLPLGVPREYAARRAEPDFPAFLRGLAARPGFFAVNAGWRRSRRAALLPGARRAGDDARGACGGARAVGAGGAVALVRPRDRRAAGRRAGVLDARRQPVGQGGDRGLAGLAGAGAGRRARRSRSGPSRAGCTRCWRPGGAVLAEVYPAEALRQSA